MSATDEAIETMRRATQALDLATAALKRVYQQPDLISMLERRGIVTTNPSEAEKCCGNWRDDDGFCQHRPYHPIYVSLH